MLFDGKGEFDFKFMASLWMGKLKNSSKLAHLDEKEVKMGQI